MSLVRKCDHCGVIFEYSWNQTCKVVVAHEDPPWQSKDIEFFDLCPEHEVEIRAWLRAAKPVATCDARR